MGAALEPVSRSSGGPRLAIGKLSLRVAADEDRARPEVPAGLEIAAAIADAFSNALDPADDSFWVIRRIRLKSRSPEQTAGAIANAVAQGLREAISRVLRGEVCDGVMRFSSRTSWLAEMLFEKSRGRALGHWAFARHSELDAYPASLIARQLFAAEPEMALPVLELLHEQGRLVPLAAAIGETGSRALLALLVPPGEQVRPDNKAAIAVEGGLLGIARSSSLPAGSWRASLAAIVAALATGELQRFPARATLDAARRSAIRRLASSPRAASAKARKRERPGAEPERRTAEGADDHGEQPSVASASLDETPLIDTPHAGIVLLWRSVRLLGLEDLLPAADRGRAALTLAATLAGSRREEAWRDPALHWLTGFEPDRRDRPAEAGPAMAQALHALLYERAAPRIVVPVVQRQSGLRIEQDQASEDWLSIAKDAGPPLIVKGMRPVARDVRFFGIARSPERRPWALLARAAYGDFGRRLLGLERSSAAWLWDNVLSGWGQVEPGSPAVLRMPRVALDLVLRMTRLDGTRFTLADGREIAIRLGGPA